MDTPVPGKRRGRLILAAGAAILLYIAASGQLRQTLGAEGTATPFAAPATRRPLTPVHGTMVSDKTAWRLDSLRGKVVLLNYAATWCAPCRRETPDLVAAADRFRDKEVAFAALMMDEGKDSAVRSAIEQYARQYEVPYPMVRPEPDPLLQFAGMGLPTSLLLDRQGRLVRTYLGPVSRATLSADIERLLGESSAISPVAP